MTEDLKKINNSQLRITTDRQNGTENNGCVIYDDMGNIACSYFSKTLVAYTTPNMKIISNVEMILLDT